MLISWLAACEPEGPRPLPLYGTVPTDTVPAFYGWVPRNILMISIDTLRKDHLDRYGDTHAAPFLSWMADSGYALDQHAQCSDWTMASTSCTLAGRHNEEAGITPQLISGFVTAWPAGTPFLATALHDAGFYSILSSTNGWLGPEWGNASGYDVAYHPHDASAWGAYREARESLAAAQSGPSDFAERWFMHVHVVEPHPSYNPPAEYLDGLADLDPVPYDLAERDIQYDVARDDWANLDPEMQDLVEQHLRVRYAGDVSWLDAQVRWIIADMDYDHLLDDTLVVVWSDHGEQFWEHGFQTHAYQLFGEENDGLLFFWSKNIVTGSWSGPTSAIDLAPTLVALQGVPVPPEMTGVVLGQAPDDRPTFAHAIARTGALSSVQANGWKLVYNWLGTVRLYDRTVDPLETTDLYDPEAPSAEAQALWAALRPQLDVQAAASPNYGQSLPDELEP
ncbi:MAG: sulfatase-like hydrolase/transferase [Myxococcota bacterium]